MGQRGRPPTPGLLTPAEERVLDHIRQGQSNAEIAVRLGISVNTVRYHVSNLLSKAGVGSRGDLAVWRPSAGGAWRRPAWAWLLAAFGLCVVAGLAVAAMLLLGGSSEPAAESTLPAGYRAYSADDLESLGMVDIGPLFEMDDGSHPVLGAELRDAAAAAVVREGATVRLTEAPGIVYPSRSASRAFQSDGPIGTVIIVLFAQEPLFEAVDVDVEVAPGETLGLVGIEVRLRESEAPHPAAVDARGHLFVAPHAFDEDIPLDYDTRRALRLTESERVADAWLPAAFQALNFCDTNCLTALNLNANHMMTAPISGTLFACASDGSQLLRTASYSLRFRRQVMVVGGTESRCDGDPRELAAGDEIGYPGRWIVSAESPSGEPLDVARSSSGALYVGQSMGPDPTCPCHGRN